MRWTRSAGLLSVILVCGAAAPAKGADDRGGLPGVDEPPQSVARIRVERVERRTHADVVQLSPQVWTKLTQSTAGAAAVPSVHENEAEIAGFPLRGEQPVTLRLSRFRITSAQTRFVLGRLGQPDQPLAFDPDSVALYSGSVAGYPHSRAFLALSNAGSHGWIELGGGQAQFAVTTRFRSGQQLAGGQLAVVRRGASGRSLPPGVPLCHEPPPPGQPPGKLDATPPEAPPPVPTGPLGAPRRDLRQLQLAVETDYELYSLFNDLDAAGAYVVALYGAVSQIYMHEVNVRVDLTYVRLWDDPNDLFNANEQPLADFRDYWNANMQSVPRDVAQFFTGRRNLSAGGVAYLSSLCNVTAYSWAGYALGHFASVDEPDVENRDIVITAHELGHNCGTGHTHNYGLDTCDQVTTPSRRGTIMSYCSQTVPGGDAVTDLRFERVIRDEIREYTYFAGCVVKDCNQNGAPDGQDIAGGFSSDANANGIPDECEDCNANGLLDPAEIAAGTSQDQNNNGVPDECEPDCNANGVPDDRDIQLGTSGDTYQNNIPDECELDCNASNRGDYNEIMANMDLDIDRDARLDSCEDCDANGVSDEVQRGGAHDLWIVGQFDGVVRRFHTRTGVRSLEVNAGVSAAEDLIITPDRRVLIASAADDRIVQLAPDGTLLGNLVPAGSGGLDFPAGMTIGPNGDLLVSSRNNNRVLRYDADSGAFLGTFVAAGSGGLNQPCGLTFAPSGNLVVVSAGNHSVREYDGQSGAFVRVLVASGAGGLNQPRGLTYNRDGGLLVCSYGNLKVLEYNGISGTFQRQFNNGGTEHELTLDGPYCVRVGPDRNVYVSRNQVPELHINRTRVYEFDGVSGIFLHNYVNGHASELWQPTGFAFMPDAGTDCNANAIVDACDILSGTSTDNDRDGVPDECAPCAIADLDGDGAVGQSDLALLLTHYGFYAGQPGYAAAADANQDLRVDQADLALVLAAYGTDCP